MSSATSIGWKSVGTCGCFERLTFFSPTIPHTNLCILVEQKACIGSSFPPESSVEEKGLESCMAVVTPVTSWTNRRGALAQAESHGPMRSEHRGGAGYRTQTSHCCTTRENWMLPQSPPWWIFTGCLLWRAPPQQSEWWFYVDVHCNPESPDLHVVLFGKLKMDGPWIGYEIPWDGWIFPGGVRYRTPYGANKNWSNYLTFMNQIRWF